MKVVSWTQCVDLLMNCFRQLVNSQRNSTWMSSKKDFGRKQHLKSTKCHDRDYFCDTLDEIMLVREAEEFNSSMATKQCSWILHGIHGLMPNSKYLQNVFIPWRQDFSYNMPLPRCSCKWLYLSSPTNATMTNPFVTLIQVKLVCFNEPSRCHTLRVVALKMH